MGVPDTLTYIPHTISTERWLETTVVEMEDRGKIFGATGAEENFLTLL